MTRVQQRLLQQLADGATHSGTALGEVLRISRAAVWKQIQALQEMGVVILSEPRQGYRLPAPVALLDTVEVLSAVEVPLRARLKQIERIWSCDSTNSELMRRLHQGVESGILLLAEHQSGGRGRRGKPWISPFGGSLYLSLLWRFSGGLMALSGLGIVVGIAMAQAVQRLGVEQARLKWPNDLHVEDRKMGGVLIELEGESEGPTDVVIGVGLNLQIPQQESGAIDQPWSTLADYLEPLPSRNRLAAAVINQLIPLLDRFEQGGLEELMPEWEALDRVHNQPVVIHQEGGAIHGIARGIDRMGALQLEVDGEIQSHYSGDVSLRLQ